MVWRHFRGFVARRLSREEYLGLHLTVGLCLSLALLGLFVLIAHGVDHPHIMTAFDQTVTDETREHRHQSPHTREFFLAVTEFGSFPVLGGIVVVGSLVLLIRGKRILTIVWLFAPIGGILLDGGLKLFFERQRPPFPDPAIHETTLSFPSGHSMGSLVGYGMVAYIFMIALPRWWERLLIVCFLSLLVMAIGFSRVYLGAHYLSDVLGGYAVGGFWLAMCISGIETVRRRPRDPPPPEEEIP